MDNRERVIANRFQLIDKAAWWDWECTYKELNWVELEELHWVAKAFNMTPYGLWRQMHKYYMDHKNNK